MDSTDKDTVLQAAHDMRAPLAVMKLLIHRYMKRLPVHEGWVLRASMERMRSISEDLLGVGRTNGPISERHNHGITVESLISPVLAEKSVIIRETGGIKFAVNASSREFKTVLSVDVTGFQRSISNLLDNAIEAVRSVSPATGRVRVMLESTDQELLIQILDNGPGIPKQIRSQLGTKRVSGKPDGNGLGVWQAKRFIENNNGSFRIESVDGVGTLVSMVLPILK